MLYLMDWPEERSWVSADDIPDPALNINFHCEHEGRPASRSRGKEGGLASALEVISVSPANQQKSQSPEF